jgi:hypothetical protein
MLISENYKNVHSGHDHGISWEQSHINSYDKPILHLSPKQAMRIPACCHRTASLQGTNNGQLHDWGRQPELKPCLDMIIEQVFTFSLERHVYIGQYDSIPCFDVSSQHAFEFSWSGKIFC